MDCLFSSRFVESHGEGLHLESRSLISHRRPLSSHSCQQTKLKPTTIKSRTPPTVPARAPSVPAPPAAPAAGGAEGGGGEKKTRDSNLVDYKTRCVRKRPIIFGCTAFEEMRLDKVL